MSETGLKKKKSIKDITIHSGPAMLTLKRQQQHHKTDTLVILRNEIYLQKEAEDAS